jgi:hypothetical protein
MGKFSAAKMFDALDQKLQKAMNYLIDLLETGYVAEGRINGKNVRTEVSPKVGFQITVDNVLVGGITDVNGLLASITQIITNDPTDPLCWASVGQYTVDAVVMNGIAIFNKNYSTTIPVCRIMTVDDGSFHLVDGNGYVRLYTSPTLTNIKDASGQARLYASSTITSLYDGTGKVRFLSDSANVSINDQTGQKRFYASATHNILYDAAGEIRMALSDAGLAIIYDSSGNVRMQLDEASNFCMMRAINGASYNEVGVDATGAYKVTAGTKVYL